MTAVMEPPAVQLKPTTPDTVTDLVDLYTERRAQLVNFAAKFAGGRDQGEDAVQEAFLKLLANPERARNAAAFVTAEAKFNGMAESKRRGEQVPASQVIEVVDWQPDPPSMLADTSPAPCMGDPATAEKVRKALGVLPERQRDMVRMHCLERVPVSEVAARFRIHKATVYTNIRVAMERLKELGVDLDEDDADADETAAPATVRRIRTGGRQVAATDDELVATLAAEFPDRWVSADNAGKTLRRVHGRCSATRANAARKAHNALCDPPKPDETTAPVRARRVSQPAAGTAPQRVTESVDSDSGAEGAAYDGGTVAEVWLMGAKPPISCLLVHADETTGSRELAAVSMAGAQREITGQLIAEGYRPDGPWVDVDPAAPEAMRKFQLEERGPR